MAIYAYKITISKKKLVSYIFTDKPMKKAKSANENGLEFTETNYRNDIAFGSLPCKVNGIRLKKSDKAKIKACSKKFKQGQKFKTLKFSDKPNEEGFYTVLVK